MTVSGPEEVQSPFSIAFFAGKLDVEQIQSGTEAVRRAAI
jgi:hypothetical protein